MEEKIAALVEQAAEAILAGDMETAEKTKAQIAALKDLYSILESSDTAALDDVAKDLDVAAEEEPGAYPTKAKAPATKATQPAIYRLPMGTGQTRETQATSNDPGFAVKSWYAKKFGTLDEEINQFSRELYGTRSYGDYRKLTFLKHVDYRRFLRTGVADPSLMQLVLLTPDQLMEAAATVGVGDIKAVQLETVDMLGGYLVPEDQRLTMIERLPGLTVVRGLASPITTDRDRVTMPKETGGGSRYAGASRAYWTDESPTSGTINTNMTFGNVNIPVHTQMTKIALSRNLLEDQGVNLEQLVNRRFTQNFAIDEDEQFLTGSGVGRPQGILNGTGTNAPHDSDVVLIASGNASAITADAIVKVPTKLDAQYRQAGASWVFTKTTRQVIETLKDGNGRYLLGDYNNPLAADGGEMLRRFPVKETEAMPEIAANTYPILFGHFSEGYTIVDRIGLAVERYLDSTTAELNQVVFIGRRRVGGMVTAGWQFVAMKTATSV